MKLLMGHATLSAAPLCPRLLGYPVLMRHAYPYPDTSERTPEPPDQAGPEDRGGRVSASQAVLEQSSGDCCCW